MARVSLGEWGQVQEETNFHWHKRASDKSSTAQQRGGIPRSLENHWGGTGKIFFCIFQDILLLGGACKAVCIIRHWGYDSQLWSFMLKQRSYWWVYFGPQTTTNALVNISDLLLLPFSDVFLSADAKSFKQLRFATCYPWGRGRNVLLSEAWNLLSALSACKWAGVCIRSCNEPEDGIQLKPKYKTQ